jgi:addiction module HigA family antidote
MNKNKLPSIHPGEVLFEDFLKPMGISQYRLAKAIGVPPRRINEIILHKRSVTADTALRLGRFFSMSPQFWMNLQTQYDLEVASDTLGGRLESDVEIMPGSNHATH